jgi:NADH:ubiquinone oxidoreductase subunit 3 (subunit A)
MLSGWDVYYVVVLSAVLALSIPAALALFSFLVSSKSAKHDDMSMGENFPLAKISDTSLGRRINTRFFLGANAALILITFALILVPCVGTVQPQQENAGTALKGLVGILSLAAFAALGLLYSAKKGDLNWLRSFREEEPPQ